MNDHTFQILLVVAGGAIGLLGSLLSSWLTWRYAKERMRRERISGVHELIGQRCALRDTFPSTSEMDSWKNWFELGARNVDQVAFMKGFLQTNNIQLGEILEDTKRNEAILEKAKAEIVELEAKVDGLKEQRSSLVTDIAASNAPSSTGPTGEM
jgi:hypothetical protein